MAGSDLRLDRVCNRDLGINDLEIVYSKVKSISAKWIPFAKSLHLDDHKITTLNTNEGHDLNYCMKKVLEYWLKKDYKYKLHGVPCWKLVCKALIAVKAELGNPAVLALAKEIACEHFILAEVTSYLPASERNFLLLSKLYELQDKFYEILQKTKRAFDSKPNLFPEIINFLVKHIIASLSGPHSSNTVITQAVRKELQRMQSIEELFSFLQQKYLSWFNYDFILKLADEFLIKNHLVSMNWRRYKTSLKDFFCKSHGSFLLKDVEGIQFGEFNSPPGAGIKVMVVKIARDDFTLNDLFSFCDKKLISKELNIPEFQLYFSFAHSNSYLEFWIPDYIYSHVLKFPLSAQQLASIEITEIICDEYVCKQPPPQQLSINIAKAAATTKSKFQEIECKVKEFFHFLKEELKGLKLKSFINEMRLKNLSESQEIDAILSEFIKTLHSSKNIQEAESCYNTFTEILKNLKIENQSALSHTQPETSSENEDFPWQTTSIQETGMSPKNYVAFGKLKEDPTQRPNSTKFVGGKQLDVKNVIQTEMVPKQKQIATKDPDNTVLHDKIIINGFQEDVVLRNDPITRKFQLSFTKMRDIILYETVPCNFFLMTVLGLPFLGSDCILDFFKRVAYTIPNNINPLSNIDYKERELSVINATLVQYELEPHNRYLWFAHTKFLKDLLSCSSAILSRSIFYNYKLEFLFDDDENRLFQDKILDAHFDFVCKNIKQIDISQCSYELQRIFSSRTVELNILDNGTNKGAHEFLSCISHHLNYNLGIICLSINDVNELHSLHGLTHERYADSNVAAMHEESKLSYIIQTASKIYSSKAAVIFIIICTEKDTKNDKEKAKEMLLKAVTDRLEFKATALTIDPSDNRDMKELNTELDKEVYEQCIMRRHIKLSWLFLQSALHSSSEGVITPYTKLKDIAEKLGINELEFKEFLETFTKFMSILYLPSFKPLQNFVILRPVEFINKLSLLFRIPDGKKDFNGLHTIENINKIIPNKELANVIIDILCSLGLAMKTTSDKVVLVDKNISSHSSLIFLPSARSGHISEKSPTSTTSLFIVYESKLTLHECQCFFASQLLTRSQSPGIKTYLQVGSEHRNIFKISLVQTIQQQEYTFSFIFHDTYIEVATIFKSNIEFGYVLEYILKCCKGALFRISSTTKKFSYNLALKCVKQSDFTDLATNKEFEHFPQSKSPWCYQCKTSFSPLRKKWKEVIEKMNLIEERRRERINVEKLLELAQKIGPVIKSMSSLNSFASQLAVTLDRDYLLVLSRSCLPWQRVFMVLLILDKRNEATRDKLKAALLRLGLSTDILE